MKKYQSIARLTILVFLLSTLLAGCSSPKQLQTSQASQPSTPSSGKSESSEASQSTENITLKVSYFQGGFGSSWFEYLKASYEDLHPNVTIEMTGDPTIDEITVAQMDSKQDVPDILFTVVGGDMYKWGAQGLLLELSDLYDTTVPGTDLSLRKYTTQAGLDSAVFKMDGKDLYYGVPWTVSPQGIIINQKLFDSNGWVWPETRQGFWDLCEQIKESGVSSPITYPGIYAGYGASMILPILGQELGVDRYNEMLTAESTDVHHDEGFLRAASEWERIFTSGYVMNGTQALDHTQSQMEFLNDKAAMIINGSWMENEMKEALPEDYNIAFKAVPAGGQLGKPAIMSQASRFSAVTSNCQNPEVAKDFILFSTTPESCAKFLESGAIAAFKFDIPAGTDVTPFMRSVVETMSDPNVENFVASSSSPLFIGIEEPKEFYQLISTGDLTAADFFKQHKEGIEIRTKRTKEELGL